MSSIHLLFKREYPINEKIKVRIPTVREVLEHEDDYYSMVSMLTATPYDMMVQLDDIGVDFTSIDDYQLFMLVFGTIKEQDTSLLFGDLDLSNFSAAVNPQNGELVFRDNDTGTVIDKAIHNQICQALRAIHGLKRNHRKAANKEAVQYLLQRARAKMRRAASRTERSQLEDLIVAMVNTEQFPYRFDEVGDLSIYQFNESVHQVIKKIDFDNKMRGIYAGTINAKELDPNELNWLTHQ